MYKFYASGAQGQGAHCVSIDTRPQKSNQTFANLQRDGIFNSSSPLFVNQISVQMAFSEPSGSSLSYVFLQWLADTSLQGSLRVETLQAEKVEYLDGQQLAFNLIFLVLFGTNMIVVVNQEYSKRQRYLQWTQTNIHPLSPIELEQRHKEQPEFYRQLFVNVNTSSVAFCCHAGLTIAITVQAFRTLHSLPTGADFTYPSQIVKENMHGDLSDAARADAS